MVLQRYIGTTYGVGVDACISYLDSTVWVGVGETRISHEYCASAVHADAAHISPSSDAQFITQIQSQHLLVCIRNDDLAQKPSGIADTGLLRRL